MDNVRLGTVGGQGMSTTTDCPWTGRCVGWQNVFCLAGARLPSGWFADAGLLAGKLCRLDDKRTSARIARAHFDGSPVHA